MKPGRKTEPRRGTRRGRAEILAGDFGPRGTPGANLDPAPDAHALRDHALGALIELSGALALSSDIYRAADALLPNLMGQIGTAHAALWLAPESPPQTLVMIRSRGFDPALARALDHAGAAELLRCFASEPRPLDPGELARAGLGDVGRALHQARVELVAPLAVRGELLGIAALGPRTGRRSYAPMDRAVIQASMAIAAVAMQTSRLGSGLIEKNRLLRLANEGLRGLDRLQSEFLSNVNHELRTPLAVVIASLDCLTDIVGEDPPGASLVRDAQNQAERLQELVEDLLTFSAADDALELHVIAGDAGALLAEYHRERMPGIAAELRELTLECAPQLPPARYDPTRLRQVLDALVDNAVKFTPRGTHIRLEVGPVRESDRAWVCIRVRDNGPGIPADQLPRLFEAFRQLDSSMTRTVGGMGLGLALARRLIGAMDGQLRAESEVGRGATFSVLLPAA